MQLVSKPEQFDVVVTWELNMRSSSRVLLQEMAEVSDGSLDVGGVSVEKDLGVAHLGQIQTWEDVSRAAQFFRSKKIIPGLLRRIRELEMRLGEDNGFDSFEGIGTISTYVSTVGVDEGVSSTGKRRKQNGNCRRRKSFGVLVLAIGILFVVSKSVSEICN
ncbi:hypothetical protein LWI29_000185 [Acer saccharum]|uniref:Uncharacterized protein n=1 Tax=Acer saccharum TaxID=4024 RepID=A0AA39S8K9_ACESA|nr:hypothetical protein LWI29_000185 [Acer saccharum]